MVPIKQMLANRANYGGMRSTSAVRYLVIHYTGNDWDSAESNGTYFQKNVTKTSAHYFVDDDSIVQSVPDNYTAYAVGGVSRYKHPSCRNSNSISIEICDMTKNGKVYPTEKTIQNAAELTLKLMKKYKIPITNVIRHYDVTGKNCPAYWVKDPKGWETFKKRVLEADEVVEKSKMIVDGKEVEVERILKDGKNYIWIRSIGEQLGYEIGNKGNIAVLTSKK